MNRLPRSIIALRTSDGLLASSTYTVLPPARASGSPSMLPDGTVMPPVDPWMAELNPFLRFTPRTIPSHPSPVLTRPI